MHVPMSKWKLEKVFSWENWQRDFEDYNAIKPNQEWDLCHVVQADCQNDFATGTLLFLYHSKFGK